MPAPSRRANAGSIRRHSKGCREALRRHRIVTIPRRQGPVARGRSTARASCAVTAVYTTSPPPSADTEADDLLAERPEALRLRRVHGPRSDPAQFLRVCRHGHGDIAVLAVDPTEGVELPADRAPDRRRRALL